MKAHSHDAGAFLDSSLLQRLGRIDLVSRVVADALRQGLRRSRRYGFSTEFSDYDPYTPGDDLRFLDWRVYARTDRLLLRKFEAETSFESLLLLDASPSMAWRWKKDVSKLEYGAQLLAAIACLHIARQDLVGLIAHDGGELRFLPPRSSRKHLASIYETLAALEPGGTETVPFLLDALARLKKHRGQVVVVTDLEEDQEALERSLELLGARDDDTVVLHLLDRNEIDPPFRRATLLEDSETGELLEVDMKALCRVHQDTIREFTGMWRRRCAHRGVRYLHIHTGMSYVDAILRLAGTREEGP